MTRRRLIVHPEVEMDVDAIVAHYAELDPTLPGRFRARLLEQVERIELFPDSGAILFEFYRRALIKRFPYMAVYAVGDSGPLLLAVINVKRDPGWIQARLSERAGD